jgi:hypothetical protein
MARTFDQGTKELEALVGKGDLTATFTVAAGGRTVPLEAGYWRNHMGRNGRVEIRNWSQGGPHATQNALEESYRDSLGDVAATVLETGPQEGMERHLDRMQEEFERRAPRVTGSLHDSTGRVVTDDGQPIHAEFGEDYGQEPR